MYLRRVARRVAGSELSPRLLGALRVLLLEHAHMQSAAASEDGLEPEGAILDSDNEDAVLAVWLPACLSCLLTCVCLSAVICLSVCCLSLCLSV